MTILHLIGTAQFAGTEQMVLTIAQGQRERGHQVYVMTRERGKVAEFLAAQGLHVIQPKIGPLSAPFRCAAFCREHGVQILHSHLASGTHVANVTSLLTGIPVVDHLHVYTRDLSHRLAARHGKVIAISQHIADYYHEKCGVPRESMALVPNASLILRDPDARMRKDLAARVVAEELRLPSGTRFVTIAGRLREQKGQDLFVDAANLIASEWPDVHFLVVGAAEDEAFAQRIREQVYELGLTGRVHMLGFRRDVAKLLRASTVAAVPSRFEPFSLSSLEPMLLGTPLVAARIGGIPEIVNRPELGVLVEPENPQSLADGMTRMLADPDYARRVSEAAQNEAMSRFSVETMLDRIDAVYGTLPFPSEQFEANQA